MHSDGTELPLGRQEGLAVYLNGTDLPDETYRDCDVDFVFSEFNRLLEGQGRGAQPLAGSDRNRALHVRRVVLRACSAALADFIASYPLCARARLERVA